ncbi:DUF4349 domain-containing protein [Salana multivorans]
MSSTTATSRTSLPPRTSHPARPMSASRPLPALRRGLRSRRTAGAALALAVATVLVAGCSGSGAWAGYDAGPVGEYDGAGGGAADEYYEAADSGDYPTGPAAPGGVSGAERSVIQTGYVYGTSEDPVTAGAEIVALVEAAGGRIESQLIVTEAEHRHPSANLTTRIPSESLTGVLAELGTVVEVVESQLLADDVTAQVVDLDARIRAKELLIERLEDLLAGSATTADIISAEETLTQRQTELEQLLTQRKGYSDAVEMATIEVNVSMPDQVPVEAPPGFSGGFTSGWDSLTATVTGALVVVGFLIPWLLALGVVLGLVLLVRTWMRSRRPAVAAASAVAAPAVVAPVATTTAAPAANPVQAPVEVAAPAEAPAPGPTAADSAPASEAPSASAQAEATPAEAPLPRPAPLGGDEKRPEGEDSSKG